MKSSDSEVKIRAIVVDDESLARKGLTMRLAQFPQVEVVQVCKNGKEALAAIAEEAPDLVFLDIQMPGMTGLQVVENLQQDNMPMIIFVTAYDAFAIDAFSANAVDYLLKPIEDERLAKAVAKVTLQVERKQSAIEKQRLLEIVIGLTGKSKLAINEWLQNPDEASEYSDRLAIKDGSSTTLVPVRDNALSRRTWRIYVCACTGPDPHHEHHHEGARGAARPQHPQARA